MDAVATPHRSLDHLREQLARAEAKNRRQAIDAALDRFQLAILELHCSEHASDSGCRRIGEARAEMIAASERT